MTGVSKSLATGPSADRAIAEMLDKISAKMHAREAVDLDALAAEHPEYAGRLRELLPALQLLADASRPDGPPLALPMNIEGAATEPLGDFRLIREVGRGGMGVVHEAEQISLYRRVALKVLPFAATLDPRQLQRFRNEAQAAACLHHPNIVPVYGVGCERGVHYYAMQLIDGQTLAEVIAEMRGDVSVRQQGNKVEGDKGRQAADAVFSPTPPLTRSPARASETSPIAALTTKRDKTHFRRIAEHVAQAADALEYAHSMGVIHRDIKPGNLMLDNGGGLWITDFGLAKLANPAREGGGDITLTGDLIGTLRYMSPEQALAKHGLVDHRTDIYSLGATLYELLTLRPAVDGADKAEMLKRIAWEDPTPLRKHNKSIPAELETITLKCLAKEPGERYATAGEMAADLRRWLNDQSIKAKPPTLARRVRSWGRHHRTLATAAAAACLFGAIVIAGGIGYIASERASRQIAAELTASAALVDADRWETAGRWPEALEAIKRAEAVLAGAEAEAPQIQSVRRRRANVETVLQLDNAQLEMASGKGEEFDWTTGANLYSRAFQDLGIDIDGTDPVEIAERLPNGAVRAEMVAALDDWARLRRLAGGGVTEVGRPLAVAKAADPDPWRNRIRDAWERSDATALKALADSAPRGALKPKTIVFFLAFLEKSAATTLLRDAQREHPADFWLCYRLAAHLVEMRPPQYAEALGHFRAALALRPNSSGVLTSLGSTLTELGRFDEAVVAFERAIRIQPEFAIAHSQLGIARSKKADLNGALLAFREAARLQPTHWKYHTNLGRALFATGNLPESVTVTRETIQIRPDDPEAHHNLACMLDKMGVLDEAEREYHEALRLNPDFAFAYDALGGLLCDKRKDFEGAIHAFQRAIELKPTWANPRGNLANAYRGKGDWNSAASAYREAIRLDATNARHYLSLGFVLYRAGKFAEAIEALSKATELSPDHADAHYYLGIAFGSSGAREKAVATLKRSVQLNPNLARNQFALGRVLREANQPEAALAAFREACRIEPNFAEALTNVGQLLHRSGDLDGAIEAYQSAIRARPNLALAHAGLAQSLKDQGRLIESIAASREAVRHNPEFAEAHGNLGGALRDLGRYREALVALRRAHELGSKRPNWPYPTAQWIKECETLALLDEHLAPYRPAVFATLAIATAATKTWKHYLGDAPSTISRPNQPD